jgi:hypothetical protein
LSDLSGWLLETVKRKGRKSNCLLPVVKTIKVFVFFDTPFRRNVRHTKLLTLKKHEIQTTLKILELWREGSNLIYEKCSGLTP